MGRTVLLAALSSGLAFGAAASPSCRGSWNVVGACYVLHGRLAVSSPKQAAVPGPRVLIRDLEGERVLGILNIRYEAGGDGVLPAGLAQLIQPNPGHTEIEGDFVLCPLDRDKQRFAMRLVCIEAASNIFVRTN